MGAVLEMPASQKSVLHDQDFYSWAAEQARLLEKGDFEHLDIKNLVEEIEDMGRSEENGLQSAIEQALLHLAKLSFSPAETPRNGWRTSVVKQRVEIEKKLRKNPGLKSKVDNLFAEAWFDARTVAIAEMQEHGESPTVPNDNPFSLENVRDPGFWPTSHRQEIEQHLAENIRETMPTERQR